jgi:dipeptidyl aminopeptidase/acylaminoacyl peptidase
MVGKMRKLTILTILLLITIPSFAGETLYNTADESPCVYTKEDNNIYLRDDKDNETQLTFKGKDYEPKLSPNGQQIIFVRHIKECPFTPNYPWVPTDFDEIWSKDLRDGKERSIVKNNYDYVSKNDDWGNYLGVFHQLHFSPDGKRIYFLCANCPTNSLLYTTDADGSNIKMICYAYQLDVVGDSPIDEYFGCLVAGVKKYPEGTYTTKWTVVLMDPDGNEIKEIDDLEEFWKHHEKVE